MSANNLLVTGASADLARDLVRKLMRGANPPTVFAHYHQSAERVDELKAEFKELIVPVKADLGNGADVERLVSDVRTRCAAPDQIVHFAGLKLRLERFGQSDLASFEADFAVQLMGIMRILREFLPVMSKAEKRTKVVFVLSSVTLGVPPKFMSLYTVIKYAQLGLMKALAADYAGTKVDINAVSPSTIETRFLANLPAKAIEMAAAQNPLKRNVTPAELTEVIEFLLSPAAGALNGVNIPVTGGMVF